MHEDLPIIIFVIVMIFIMAALIFLLAKKLIKIKKNWGKSVSEQDLQKGLYVNIIVTLATFGFKYATISSGSRSVNVYGAAELIFLIAALDALVACLLVYKKMYDYLIASSVILLLINFYRMAAIYQMSGLNKIDSSSTGEMTVHHQNLFLSLAMSGILVYLCFSIRNKFGKSSEGN